MRPSPRTSRVPPLIGGGSFASAAGGGVLGGVVLGVVAGGVVAGGVPSDGASPEQAAAVENSTTESSSREDKRSFDFMGNPRAKERESRLLAGHLRDMTNQANTVNVQGAV